MNNLEHAQQDIKRHIKANEQKPRGTEIATPAMVRDLNIALKNAIGVYLRRKERLSLFSLLLGYELTTTKDLTNAECWALDDALRRHSLLLDILVAVTLSLRGENKK